MDNLRKRGVGVDEECVFCHGAIEEASRLLIHCSSIKRLWENLFSDPSLGLALLVDVKDALTRSFHNSPLF